MTRSRVYAMRTAFLYYTSYIPGAIRVASIYDEGHTILSIFEKSTWAFFFGDPRRSMMAQVLLSSRDPYTLRSTYLCWLVIPASRLHGAGTSPLPAAVATLFWPSLVLWLVPRAIRCLYTSTSNHSCSPGILLPDPCGLVQKK